MREVVVILSVMCASQIALHGGVRLLSYLDDSSELDTDPPFVGMVWDQPITKRDLVEYNRIYRIKASRSVADEQLWSDMHKSTRGAIDVDSLPAFIVDFRNVKPQ